MKKLSIVLFVAGLSSIQPNLYASDFIVYGRNFQVAATQEINFVPLKTIHPSLFKGFLRSIDLKKSQSSVKSQGERGACTYFVRRGEEWGRDGYGTIPFDYIDQMSPRKLITGYIEGTLELPSGK